MEKLIYKPFMLNSKTMAEDGKIFGISKSVFWRVVGCVCILCACGVSLYACQRSISVDILAKRNGVIIQYVTPKK